MTDEENAIINATKRVEIAKARVAIIAAAKEMTQALTTGAINIEALVTKVARAVDKLNVLEGPSTGACHHGGVFRGEICPTCKVYVE